MQVGNRLSLVILLLINHNSIGPLFSATRRIAKRNLHRDCFIWEVSKTLEMLIKETSEEKIISSLSRDDINILLIAEHTELDIDSLIGKCNEEGIVIAGGIFPMIISDEESLESGIINKVIEASATICLVEDMSGLVQESLPKLPTHAKSGIVFVDGLSPDIPNFLGSLYDQYWNQISYIGGGCGSLTLQQKPCVFTNEGFHQNAAVLVLSDLETQLGVKHGWEKIDGPFVANKTEGNKVIELNWRPAFDVYKEVVEANTDQRFDSSYFFDIAKGFPFGIYREGQEDIVRDPISVDEDGTLVCVGKVESNTSLNILKGNNQILIENAKEAANKAMSEKARDLFVSDCISRILYLEDDFKKELLAIKESVNKSGVDVDVEGVLSIGEISSGINGYLEFYNKTVVVSTFS